MSNERKPKKIRISAGKRPESLDLVDINNMRLIIGGVNIDVPVEIPVGELRELLRHAGRALEPETIVLSPDAQAALDGYEWMKAQTTARNPTGTTMLEDRLAEALLASQAEVMRLRRGR